MSRSLVLWLIVLFSVACKSSDLESDVRQELDDRHNRVIELTKSEKFEEAISVAQIGLESLKTSGFSMADQLRYLARFSNELAVLKAHLRRFDDALNDIDIAIGASKELVNVDDIFYFDVFEFSEQKAQIIRLYKGQQKESLYRHELLREISNAVKNSDEKLLIRQFEHHIRVLFDNCADTEMQFCKSNLIEQCRWMVENYKKYLSLNLKCELASNEW